MGHLRRHLNCGHLIIIDRNMKLLLAANRLKTDSMSLVVKANHTLLPL